MLNVGEKKERTLLKSKAGRERAGRGAGAGEMAKRVEVSASKPGNDLTHLGGGQNQRVHVVLTPACVLWCTYLFMHTLNKHISRTARSS